MKRTLTNALKRVAWRFFRRIQRGPAAGLRFDATGFPLAYVQGTMEPAVQEALVANVQPGQVVYDIGANCGFFSVLAARLTGEAGRVYAFEPVPDHIDAIRRNAELNQFAQIVVKPMAVGATTGEEALAITDHPGGATLRSTGIVPPDMREYVNVSVVSIDDLLMAGKLPPPDFVKIDVEGAELAVIRGMSTTLRTIRPVLIYEVDANDPKAFEERWDALDRAVEEAGYRVERLPRAYTKTRWQVGHSIARPA
ncbi:MAG: FkbM family methyltransferase [Rhodothermales bacterium]